MLDFSALELARLNSPSLFVFISNFPAITIGLANYLAVLEALRLIRRNPVCECGPAIDQDRSGRAGEDGFWARRYAPDSPNHPRLYDWSCYVCRGKQTVGGRSLMALQNLVHGLVNRLGWMVAIW
ncbi:hypothetical protein [Rhizobium aegyptiacum]|uniref:hypothetical protein n=1 Tax=Rhizobium aegyptiacum TaxID=1764550 RepID=UPI000A7BB147|nr:hypothetical protein [Rhizobium aegyptiacum]